MSISSVLNPTALVSQALGSTPVGAAASGAASFISTLLQTLQQAGTVSPSSSTANGSATATAPASTGTLHASGHRHGHHGGGMAQLAQLLQQTQPGVTSAASGTAAVQPGLQSLLQSLPARAAPAPGQLLNTAV